MKLKLPIVVAALAAGIAQTCLAVMPAPLPEFKSREELRQSAAVSQIATNLAQSEAFYTGKPYESTGDGYLFKYRSYDSELSRWTSFDPSGFPDGANNYIYSATPTNELDAFGLWTTAQYVAHYWTGNGSEVNLASVGDGTKVSNYTTQQRHLFLSEIDTKIYMSTLVKKPSFSGNDSLTINIDYQSALYVLGNSNLKIDYTWTGTGFTNPSTGLYIYQFTANLTYHINDMFEDPADFDDSTPGSEELPGGHPYAMTHTWSGEYIGSGSYE